MVNGYGSTADRNDVGPPITPPRRNLSANASSAYKTPTRSGDSIPRSQSNSAETTRTQESDPLLGEKLLISDVEDVKVNLSKSLQPSSAAFEGASDDDQSKTRRDGRRDSETLDSVLGDSLIGNNVVVYDEMDTLAYSYEQDDSTLMQFLDAVEERKRGFCSRFIGSDPAIPLVCFGLALGIGICIIPALLYVQYHHHHHQAVSIIVSGGDVADKTSTVHSAQWSGVPFQKISRASYGDPVSNFLDESLFHPSLLYDGQGIVIAGATTSTTVQDTDKATHTTMRNNDERRSLASSSMKPFLRKPFPTGAFWTNLVLLPQTSDGKPKQSTKSQSSYPIVAYPYSYQWSPLGKLQVSYSALRRKIQSNSIQDAFAPDMTIGSVDNIHNRHVVKYDSLSVTLRFYGDAETSGKQNSTDFNDMKHWDTYIVQGSPYITARYYGLRPELTAMSDFTDIACPPTMRTEESKNSNSTLPHGRRMSIFSPQAAPGETGTNGKRLGVCGISETSTQQKKVITGVQFVVTTQEGLMWLVFASEPITFEFNQAARRNMISSNPFQGVIRLALVPPTPTNVPSAASNGAASAPLDMEQLASSSGVKRLIYHASTFPIGGTVQWSFRSGTRAPLASKISSGRRRLGQLSSSAKENNIGSITFTFNTMHMSALEPSTSTSAQMDLLMLSLPHHAASISSADKMLFDPQDFDLFFRCIKGRMVPVIGKSWTYEEKLTPIGFDDETSLDRMQNPSLSVSTLDQSVRDLILQTVDSDLNINLPVLSNGAYSFGKGIARLAQLALIADTIERANESGTKVNVQNVTNSTNDSHVDQATTRSPNTTSERAYALLEKYLTLWLAGDGNTRRLFFDVDLGGIVSKHGLKDVFSDFGNARYNDHHFHYGYILYAASILGKAKPNFISQYGSHVDSIFYDVAHNSSAVMNLGSKSEIFFPFARHKSWFDGHSFASGLFPFANGKSQESSSEATNCYFGAYLWSKVRWAGSPDGDKIVDYARLLLATEITGAKTYWHMTPKPITPFTPSTSSSNLLPVPYNTIFQQNYMVGNLGMTDVTSTTWFGTEVVYVHLINFMPVTAITSELFDEAYVKGEQQVLMKSGSVEKAWAGYVISNEAIVDPNNAWTEAQTLVSNELDAGSSKSQVLYWISTRPGFLSNTTAIVPANDNQSGPSPPEAESVIEDASVGSASCSSHDNCVKSNLSGLCCPTADGIMLSCCN